MYIKQVEIEGFGSYLHKTTVSSLCRGVNVIVGRNGSGKSNFLDALRFVFGEMENEELQNSINRTLNPPRASVTVTFGRDDDSDFSVTRMHTLKKDEWRWNGRFVPATEIKGRLEAIGVAGWISPFFIMQQGEITALAEVSSKKRLTAMEKASGIHFFDNIIAEGRNLLKEAEESSLDVNDYKGKANEILSLLEEEIVDLDKWRHYKSEQERLKSLLDSWKLWRATRQFEEVRNERNRALENLETVVTRLKTTNSIFRRNEETFEEANLREKLLRTELKMVGTQLEKIEAVPSILMPPANEQQYFPEKYEEEIAAVGKERCEKRMMLLRALALAKEQLWQGEEDRTETLLAIKRAKYEANMFEKRLTGTMQMLRSVNWLKPEELTGLTSVRVAAQKLGLAQNYFGTLSECIRFSPSLAIAVENTMGSKLVWHVVKDKDTLFALRAMVCDQNIVIKAADSFMSKDPGIESLAVQIEVLKPAVRDMAISLLDEFNLSHSLEGSFEKAIENGKQYVTLKGELISPIGVFSGGSMSRSNSTIDLIKEFVDTSTHLSTLKSIIENSVTKLARLNEEFARNHEEVTKLSINVEKLADETDEELKGKSKGDFTSSGNVFIPMWSEEKELQQPKAEEIDTDSLSENRCLNSRSRIETTKERFQELKQRLVVTEQARSSKFEAMSQIKDIRGAHLREFAQAERLVDRLTHRLLAIKEMICDNKQQDHPDQAPEELAEEISRLDSEIEKLSGVNKRASDIYSQYSGEIKILLDQFDQLQDEMRRTSDIFSDAYSAREQTIEAFLSEVSYAFTNVFSLLENGGDGKLDRNCDILARFQNSPHYLCCNQLSGGQKVLCALVLIFAFHQYRPFPFYVLDEIDANLDPEHRRSVANFLAKIVQGGQTQVICTTFYSQLIDVASEVFGVIYRSGESSIQHISQNLAQKFCDTSFTFD